VAGVTQPVQEDEGGRVLAAGGHDDGGAHLARGSGGPMLQFLKYFRRKKWQF
jgi:hypothetical protein